MSVLRSEHRRDLRRARGAVTPARRAPAALLAAVLLVTLALPATAQTPYDPEPAPPAAPIQPTPSPAPTPAPRPTPDVTALPLVPLPRPAPGAFGAAAGTVGGEPVTITLRDPSARISADDPVLTLLPSVAVVGDGDRLLLPVGPAGSSREIAVTDVRVLELPGVAALLVATDADGEVRPQGTSGAFEVEEDSRVALALGGLAPGSDARLTLFSDPFPLGTFPVGADGSVLADAPIPPGVPVGEHLLQIDAVRADGAVLSVAQLIEVLPAVAPAPEPAPTPEPAPAPAPEPAPAPADEAPADDARTPDLTLSLGLALALLVVVLVLRLLLARRRDADDDTDSTDDPSGTSGTRTAPAGTRTPSRAASSGARPPLSGTGALGIVVLTALIVVGAWIVLAGATLTRPRVESLVALVALQWLGLRLLGGRSGDEGLPASVGMLGAAAGLTLGTGVHVALDAFFDALPLLSGAPGPHLPLGVTLGTLALAALLAAGVIAAGAARTRPSARGARSGGTDAASAARDVRDGRDDT